jgi:hypothetical protein
MATQALAAKTIVAGADFTIAAKPASSTDAFNRLVKLLSAQNNTAVPCTLAIYIGPSATGIKIWEGPLAVNGGGVADIDFSTKDGSREKEYGLSIVTAAGVQEDLKGKVTSGGAVEVYVNVLIQTGGGGL